MAVTTIASAAYLEILLKETAAIPKYDAARWFGLALRGDLRNGAYRLA
jgi:hypothetical protein